MSNLRQRVPTTTCAKCRKLFAPGDRVLTVYIVQRVGRNMETKDMGAWLGEDFELVHASCVDPQLTAQIIHPT